MLKLGKLTDYGTVLMTALAADAAHPHSAQDLATRTRITVTTVAKLLKLLGKAGLVESIRGARGGYRLARSPRDISVADIVAALEGPIALTQCSVHDGCSIEHHCGVRSNWRVINDAVRTALTSVTLADMTAPLQRTGAAPAEHPVRFAPRPIPPASPPGDA
ncbi:MAG TPA: SUF system Fe-S cluster assembly regulator [Nevskiaceae bacterium]|nr:SUF system Fe-S cluster assembly regulator [Nevskiaceae bacterium]